MGEERRDEEKRKVRVRKREIAKESEGEDAVVRVENVVGTRARGRRVHGEEEEEEAEKEMKKKKRRATKMDRRVFTARAATLNNSRARFPRRRANMNRIQVAFVASLDFRFDAKTGRRRDAARETKDYTVRSIVAKFTAVASSWRRKMLDVLFYTNPIRTGRV